MFEKEEDSVADDSDRGHDDILVAWDRAAVSEQDGAGNSHVVVVLVDAVADGEGRDPKSLGSQTKEA